MRPILESHCFKCHGKEEVNGEVNLLALKTLADFTANPKLIQEVIEVLVAQDMPPEDEPELDDAVRTRLLSALKEILRSATNDDVVVEVRRLNRSQYNYAVRDLFELDRDVFVLRENLLQHEGKRDLSTGTMPEVLTVTNRGFTRDLVALQGVQPFAQDLRAKHGFDNQADSLTLSPLLLESFLALSGSIVNSPDFNEKTCGVWNWLFVEPKNDRDLEQEIERRLMRFLTRAFRRPIDETTLKRYVARAMRAAKDKPFAEAMKLVASAAIASPRFLYRYSTTVPDASPEDLQFELASRLSFFLWGSVPDEWLIQQAKSGALADPDSLRSVIDTMLADERVLRFTTSFATQWLQLERARSALPSKRRYRSFYHDSIPASAHMVLEPLLLFETVFVENRPLVELLNPEFTYRSEFLDLWYGQNEGKELPKRRGADFMLPANVTFRRTPISDRRYGGVVNNAAILTMTSGPVESRPIVRGAWFTEVILNDPPPPPPNNVKPLDQGIDREKLKTMTVREKFATHRDNPACASCHARLDPWGFALENFNEVGLWRDVYANKREVDAATTVFKKHTVGDASDLKTIMAKEDRRFARAMAGHLLKYALSRSPTPRETLMLDEILDRAATSEFRLKSMIREVALSQSFTLRQPKAKGVSE